MVFFFIKCSDIASDHRSVPSPVAQLVIYFLQPVQPLEGGPITLHKLTLRPSHTQTMPPANAQILNVQWNHNLYILFQRNLQILERSKPKQTTIFDLNHMPLLSVPGAERGLPELIKHLNGLQSCGASPLHLTDNVSDMRMVICVHITFIKP